ncbi:MAG TPA: hypothetical protein VHV83_03650 [Armatimonadota bacterium]|nr:hypothetical protein [Armatimonadota bacterium]
MHKPNLETLARRVMSDPVFRSLFLADPEVAVNEAGLDILPDDLQALKEWHVNLRNVTKLEELERALAKFVASRSPGAYK